jgi:hypothetical protein
VGKVPGDQRRESKSVSTFKLSSSSTAVESCRPQARRQRHFYTLLDRGGDIFCVLTGFGAVLLDALRIPACHSAAARCYRLPVAPSLLYSKALDCSFMSEDTSLLKPFSAWSRSMADRRLVPAQSIVAHSRWLCDCNVLVSFRRNCCTTTGLTLVSAPSLIFFIWSIRCFLRSGYLWW